MTARGGVALIVVLLAGRAQPVGGATLPQDRPVTIASEVDTSLVTVGDRLWLTVTVEHEPGASVTWPDSIDLGPFEVVTAERLAPERLGDRVRSRVRIGLAAFELGDLEIPSMTVTVTGPDSSSSLRLATEPQSVTVVSVGRDESGDIRGIKGPLDIPRNWLLLVPWIAAAGLVAGGAWWLWRRYRAARRAEPAAVTPAPRRPPHEIALEALTRLERSDLLQRGEIKAYYIDVSDIVRIYVEGRFHVEAMEMASHEVLQGLESVDVPFETRLSFEQFFGACDLVKFAKHVPALAECERIVPQARALVECTRVPEAVDGGATVSAGSSEGEGGSP